MTSPLRPTLVTMVWRGGERFERCLRSIDASASHFDRIILSVTSAHDSADMVRAREFADAYPGVEVICTGAELPTMQHQAYWVDYLETTGTKPNTWIYWLAYDDEVRLSGIEAIVDNDGNWPLKLGTAYFGPWAMRHERADVPFEGPRNVPLESWTSFPKEGPLRLPVLGWITRQLAQPTYMQMSGSVAPFASFVALRDAKPAKTGPMRIEMAIAAAPPNTHVAEFAEPVSIIYGRANSDRAAYGKAARSEDKHLAHWLGAYLRRHPTQGLTAFTGAARIAGSYAKSLATRGTLPTEEWRVRDIVNP